MSDDFAYGIACGATCVGGVVLVIMGAAGSPEVPPEIEVGFAAIGMVLCMVSLYFAARRTQEEG